MKRRVRGRSGGGGGIERVGRDRRTSPGGWNSPPWFLKRRVAPRAIDTSLLVSAPRAMTNPGGGRSGSKNWRDRDVGAAEAASTVRDGTERTPRRCHGVPVPRDRRRQGRRQKGEKDRQESQAGARDAPASPTSAPTPARDRLVTSRHSPRHRPSLFPSYRTAHEPLVRPQRRRYSSG